MRVSVMANEGDHLGAAPWLAAALGAGAVMVGNLLLSMAQRLLGKAAIQSSMTAQFVALMNETRTELTEARRQRDKFEALLKTERAEREIERADWRTERDTLKGEIRQLKAISQGFERLLRRHGVDDMPERETPPEAVRTIETTVRRDGPAQGEE